MSTKWSTQVLGKSSTTNFGALLKDEFTVILLRGKNVFGDLIYCYVKVAFPDVEKLQSALAGDVNFNASDFGTVVAAGKGEPTEEVKGEIAIMYPMLSQSKPLDPLPKAAPPAAEPIPSEKKAWDEY